MSIVKHTNSAQGIQIAKIIRSRRKTIGLQLSSDASLIIRAPKSASLKSIYNGIAKHANWILKKQEEIKLHPRQSAAKKYLDGEQFMFMGLLYSLNILGNGSMPLRFDDGFYLSHESLPKAKELFTEWYISRAREIIPDRLCLYARNNNLKFDGIGITNAKSRWGSCNIKGRLNFSWRLIMAPMQSIDYVVVHELAHLIHRDHSRDFWAEVEKMMPDYKMHKRWLRDNERLMTL